MHEEIFNLAENPFISIQCEGSTIGKVSYFIRFYGCNHRCTYCDSSFTFNSDTETIKISLIDLVKDIQSSKVTNIVITGGEPTLYLDKIIALVEELEKYDDSDYTFEIETNGSIELRKEFIDRLWRSGFNFQFNISPKLDYLDDKAYDILKKNIRTLKFFKESFILKFVHEVKTEQELFTIIDRLKNDIKYIKDYIYIMPECRTRKEHLKNFEFALKFCKQYNLIFSPRLHILLYNDLKGV